MNEEGFRPPYEVETAAKRLNITEYQVRHAFRRGEIGGFRVGKSIRIWPREVDRLLGADKSPSHEPPPQPNAMRAHKPIRDRERKRPLPGQARPLEIDLDNITGGVVAAERPREHHGSSSM
jgi:excisionase family DNA binding protein